MHLKIGITVSSLFLLVSSAVLATTYRVPAEDESLIGEIHYQYAGSKEKAANIAERYDVGHNSLRYANPYINMDGIPSGSAIQVPTKHLLPNEERRGIVINLAEMRMYYFPKGTHEVLTYPIGIGKIGKTIPVTKAIITRKTKNPIWIPPDDIREFNLEKGIILPKIMPPGPDNPLGPFAIYMSVPTYLIHSTIFPDSIGKRASFGCIRMYESDIKQFFPSITTGIPVAIINAPVKTGWQHDRLYMEAHMPLEEHREAYDASLSGMVHQVHELSKNKPTLVDWQMVSYISDTRDGLPHEVGMHISP